MMEYLKNHRQDNITYQHEITVDGVYLFESWLVGENDKSVDMGFDLPIGSWMVSLKVENNEVWKEIKSGKGNGFSIEAVLTRTLVDSMIMICEDGSCQIESGDKIEAEIEELFNLLNNLT